MAKVLMKSRQLWIILGVAFGLLALTLYWQYALGVPVISGSEEGWEVARAAVGESEDSSEVPGTFAEEEEPVSDIPSNSAVREVITDQRWGDLDRNTDATVDGYIVNVIEGGQEIKRYFDLNRNVIGTGMDTDRNGLVDLLIRSDNVRMLVDEESQMVVALISAQ